MKKQIAAALALFLLFGLLLGCGAGEQPDIESLRTKPMEELMESAVEVVEGMRSQAGVYYKANQCLYMVPEGYESGGSYYGGDNRWHETGWYSESQNGDQFYIYILEYDEKLENFDQLDADAWADFLHNESHSDAVIRAKRSVDGYPAVWVECAECWEPQHLLIDGPNGTIRISLAYCANVSSYSEMIAKANSYDYDSLLEELLSTLHILRK